MTQLVLSNNGLTDAGVKILCEGLGHNDSVMAVDLAANPLTDAVASTLVGLAISNEGQHPVSALLLRLFAGMVSLNVNGTHLSSESQQRIHSVLEPRVMATQQRLE